MSWNDEPEPHAVRTRNEYMTLGPYRFPYERDQACNELCASGDWYMHSSDICPKTGGYIAVMARNVVVR